LTILTILIPRIFNHLPKILDQLFSLLIRSIIWEKKYVKTIKHYLEEINLENKNKNYSLKEKNQNITFIYIYIYFFFFFIFYFIRYLYLFIISQ